MNHYKDEGYSGQPNNRMQQTGYPPQAHSMVGILGTVMVVIVWQLDLLLILPNQSVPIATKVVSSNPAHGEMYSIQHYVIKFVGDL